MTIQASRIVVRGMHPGCMSMQPAGICTVVPLD
jgi:hypothetical protein